MATLILVVGLVAAVIIGMSILLSKIVGRSSGDGYNNDTEDILDEIMHQEHDEEE